MPITLSINPSFKLLQRHAFGTVFRMPRSRFIAGPKIAFAPLQKR
jgi:hypothetical protein